MTSLYRSATEVVNAMATTAINDDPVDGSQLTAATNSADEAYTRAVSETTGSALPQEHRENNAEAGDSKGGEIVQDDASQQIKMEEETASSHENAEVHDRPFDLSTIPDAKLEGVIDEAIEKMGPDMGAAHAMLENEQTLENYDSNVAGLADGLQPIIPNGPQSLELYNGLPLDEAQALMDFQMMQHLAQQPYLDPPPPPVEDTDPTRIQAYAKLEFSDGEFYMNTFSVFLGRDLQAARAAMRRDKEEEKIKIETEAASHEPNTPVRIKREDSRYSRSIVSDTGGILRDFSDSDSDKPTKKKKSRKASKKSKSTGSSSQLLSRRNSLVPADGPINYQPQAPSRRAGPETVGAASLDLASLRPSPYECPLIGIHPPASASASAYKSISRKHVKIAYNSSKRLFEAEILGRNGAFVDEQFCHYSEIKELKSGSCLQIGVVTVKFVLPDVVAGQTGAEQRADYEDNLIADRYSEGGKEMSFDFEEGPRDGVNLEDTSEESSEDEGAPLELQNDAKNEELAEESEEEDEQDQVEEEEEEEEEGEEEEGDEEDSLEDGVRFSFADDNDEDEAIEGNEEQTNSPDSSPKRDKKRGPGRPPKNGIMSKREQKLAKKEAMAQQKQKAKKSVQQPTVPTPVTGKNKVGRPRKHPRPDTPPIQKEKRKYTKRKPKEPKDPNSKDEDQPPKEKKEKKPAKPPRSPSPEMKESDYTPEQLAKPSANYVILIHEALSNSPTGQLNLQDIYRAIQRKHPYYKFKCATIGWQSSVRHNVQQHPAFQKGEKDGKGHFWSLVDGVSIEKEKKRRTTPPPQGHPHMHPQPIYQAGYPPHLMPGHHYGPPPPGYQMGFPMPPNGHHMQQPQFPPPHPQSGLPPHPMAHPQMNVHLPHPFPIPPQLAPPNPSTYSSPYAPTLPISTTPQLNEPRPGEPRPNEAQNPAHATAPGPPPQRFEPQPAPQPPQPGSFRPDEKIQQFIEHFKPTLVKLLAGKSDKPEAIVESVVNRVLGVTTASTVNDDPHEKLLIETLNKQLSTQYGDDFKPSVSVPSPAPHNNQQQSPANQVGTQGHATEQPVKSTGSERSTPTVMRPSFTGRPHGTSIPRPPMKTPGMQRTNSGSPANAPPRQSVPLSSASPAPAPASPGALATNGASTPKLTPNGSGPVVGQKRAFEEADDLPEAKRLNGSSQLGSLKHPLEDVDDNRDFKGYSTSGPPQLKT